MINLNNYSPRSGDKTFLNLNQNEFDWIKDYYATTYMGEGFGNKVQIKLLRLKKDSNIYKPIYDENILTIATLEPSNDPSTYKNLAEEIERTFLDLQTAGGTLIGIKYTNKSRAISTLSNPEVRNLLDRKLVSETSLVLKDLKYFTNDPSKNSLFCFDLSKFNKTSNIFCPHWLLFEEQMKRRNSNYDIISIWRASVYSIYKMDELNPSKQIIVIIDSGESGKSTIVNALSNPIINIVGAIPENFYKSNFASSNIHGKRLILFTETKYKKYLNQTLFKAITGGDLITIERKGLNAFQYIPKSRILVTSNEYPDVNLNNPYEKNRILFFSLDQMTQEEKFNFLQQNNFQFTEEFLKDVKILGKSQAMEGHAYKNYLDDEFSDYLSLCSLSYQKICPRGGNILPPDEMYDDINNSCSTDTSNIQNILFKEYLEFDSYKFLKLSDLKTIYQEMESEYKLERDFSWGWLNDEFIRKKCFKTSKKIYGKTYRGWVGVGLRQKK